MLCPISWGVQPFKFVKLYDDDERRLDAAIRLSVEQGRLERVQMDNPRAL
jgi:hypothetical protein